MKEMQELVSFIEEIFILFLHKRKSKVNKVF